MALNLFARNTRETGTFTDMTRGMYVWRICGLAAIIVGGLAGMASYFLVPLTLEGSRGLDWSVLIFSAWFALFPWIPIRNARRTLNSEIREVTGVVESRWEFYEDAPGADHKHRWFSVEGMNFDCAKLYNRIREGDRLTVRHWGRRMSIAGAGSAYAVESLTIHELASETADEV